MYDKAYIKILFNQIYSALIKIKERTENIHSANDFTTKEGEEKLDSICIQFMAIGENLKKISIYTNDEIFHKYSHIDWKGLKGFRDVLAHQYFNIDEEQVFIIIKHELPKIIETVENILSNEFQ